MKDVKVRDIEKIKTFYGLNPKFEIDKIEMAVRAYQLGYMRGLEDKNMFRNEERRKWDVLFVSKISQVHVFVVSVMIAWKKTGMKAVKK